MVKMQKFTITLLMLLLVAFSSCQKEPIVKPADPVNTKDLTISSDFDWRTSKIIEMTVVGLTGLTISNVITISSTTDGSIYINDLLNMGEKYLIKFKVPSTETSLTVKYGVLVKVIDVTAVSSISYDYVTE
jgi:hypothetical protein